MKDTKLIPWEIPLRVHALAYAETLASQLETLKLIDLLSSGKTIKVYPYGDDSTLLSTEL